MKDETCPWWNDNGTTNGECGFTGDPCDVEPCKYHNSYDEELAEVINELEETDIKPEKGDWER